MSKFLDVLIENAGWITAIIAFSIPPVRDFVMKKFQLSIDKVLEDKKSLNERKNYISKVKFDTEFNIYREMSKNYFYLIKQVNKLIPYGISTAPVFITKTEKDEYEKKIYQDTLDVYLLAQESLNANAAFIFEDFYNEYKEILTLCSEQLEVFQQRWNLSYSALKEEDKLPTIEDFKRTKEISERFEKLSSKIRNYISNLEVL